MFDLGSSLFWYKLVFMTELLLSWAVFTHRLKRRNAFPLRLAGSVAISYAAAFVFPIFFYNAWYTSLMFLCLFAVTVPAMKLCLDEPWRNVMFCGIAAYTTQHLAYEAYNLAMTASGVDLGIAIGMYGYALPPNINILTVSLYADCYAVIYFCMYMLFARRISRHEDLKVDNAAFMLLAAAIVLIDILLSAITVYNSETNYDKVYLIVLHVYNMLCCVFAINMQFGLMHLRRIRKERDAVSHLLAAGREQYDISKENIELINRKCHDLRHQVRLLVRDENVRDRTVAEIENAISIYDSAVKTGNEALDIILTEKSLKCRENGIQLSCIADGKCLTFMDVSDIYTLFGNAMENAMEAVMKTDDREKRFIRLKVTAHGSLLSVRIENWFDGNVRFRAGLPETTKSRDGWHGYGLKSMKFIAEKYGGDMTVKARGNMFVVELLMPLPGK